jgi:[acyl-carrier-protein] S-malonyltransferase
MTAHSDVDVDSTDTAIVFPGISETPFDEVSRFLVINPVARRLTAAASETLGYSLVDRYREAEGPFSEYERVAFLVVCVALAQWAEEKRGSTPDLCVGPSFGGTPAAVYSGALDFSDAVWLTAQWTRYLADYFAEEHRDVVTQSFARVPQAQLTEILQELDDMGEWHDIACHVDHDFWMLSVRERNLDWLHRSLRARGGLPMYTMSPPMHSRAFAPLRDIVDRELISKLTFHDPTIPIVSDHDGTVLDGKDQVRALILDGIVRPVAWPTALATLTERGITRLLVSGPDTLWGRVNVAKRAFEVAPLTPALALRPRLSQRTIAA